MRKTPILLLCFVFIFSCSQQENNEPFRFSAPEELGFTNEFEKDLDLFFDEQISDNKIAGAVALIARDGQIALEKAWGWQDMEDERAMETHHLFRLASMTKSVTSVAILQLYEKGMLEFDDPVETFIPEFANPVVLNGYDAETGEYETRPASGSITLHHLLTHSSGIAYDFTHRELSAIYQREEIPSIVAEPGITLVEVMARLGRLPLAHDPGAAYTYGLSTDVLGRVVEVVSGLSLAEYFDQYIFEPLGMNNTGFYLPGRESDLTTLYSIQNGEFIRFTEESGTLNANFPVQDDLTYYAGGAGLTSTARDYFIFIQALLNGGEWNGIRIIENNTLEFMKTNQIGDLWNPNKFSYGLMLTTPEGAQEGLRPAGSLGWGGVFQTTYWIDQANEMVVVMMAQVIPSPYRDEFYNEFEKIVYRSLVN